MTGILTGVKTPCVNSYLPPYTTISFSKAWIRCVKAGYWLTSRLRVSWTRHRTAPSGVAGNHVNLVSAIRLPTICYRYGHGSGQRPDCVAEEHPKIGTDRKGAELYREPHHIRRYPYQQQLCRSGRYRPSSVSMGKNMYGQPAMNFIHEEGVGAISEHLRQLLAQDVEDHLDRKLYDDNLSRSNNSTILKTEFETLLETAGETERQEVQEERPQPYEPMLNLFAAYADEEQAEVQVVESRPSPNRAPSASRKKKGDELEMFNLFSQEHVRGSRHAGRHDRGTGSNGSQMAGAQTKNRGRAEEGNGTTSVYRRDTSRIQERLSRESR